MKALELLLAEIVVEMILKEQMAGGSAARAELFGKKCRNVFEL
ncbi:MAG: hypothetical protein ACLP0B_10110 [Steroidobacteraceae bacterium]|jgi:hypothetical protein